MHDLNLKLSKRVLKRKKKKRGGEGNKNRFENTLRTPIQKIKKKKKKKKKNSRFPTQGNRFTFHGSIGAESRSARDRAWFKRNTDLTLPGYARSACVLLSIRGLVLKTHSCILADQYLRTFACMPAHLPILTAGASTFAHATLSDCRATRYFTIRPHRDVWRITTSAFPPLCPRRAISPMKWFHSTLRESHSASRSQRSQEFYVLWNRFVEEKDFIYLFLLFFFLEFKSRQFFLLLFRGR